jgi:hypothetical protein
MGAAVLRARRGAQRIQDRPHDGGAFRCQVPVQHPGALEGRLQGNGPVLEPLRRIFIGQVAPGPLVQLRGQPGQIPQVHPCLRCGQQDRVGGRTAVLGQLVSPLADGPAVGLRQILGGQRRHHPRMRHHPLSPCGMCHRDDLGDAGFVDQPGSRTVIRIRAVPLARGERAQDRGPGSRHDRVGPLHHLQGLGLGLGGHPGRVGVGHEPQPGLNGRHCIGDAGKRRNRVHPDLPPGRVPVLDYWLLPAVLPS